MGDDYVVLNDGLEKRTSSTGRVRYTTTIKSEPLVHNFDAKALGAGPAQAIAQFFRDKIKGITTVAAPATIKARKVAARAFAAGKPWAVRRYSGGKTGALAPNQSERAFNDSGRFAQTIAVGATKDGYVVNVAANRLDEATGKVDRIWARLIELVPEIRSAQAIANAPSVQQAIAKSIQGLIIKAEATGNKLGVERIKRYIETGRKFLEMLDVFAA